MADGNSRLNEALDKLRERQLQAWQSGQPLLVESLASDVTPPLQENELLELVFAEVTLRADLGEAFTWDEYLKRFPQFTDALKQRFADHQVTDAASVETRSFIADAANESPNTVDQPKPGSTSAPFDGTVLSDPQGAVEDVARPVEAPVPAALASTVTYISSSGIGTQHKGRYRLDRILGEGAFGQVYLAFDEELQRQVAIKVPTKDRFQKADDAEAYLAEARTVASLDHPHIVPVYDVGRTQDDSIYVVSRFIEGSTLEDLIKTGRTAERESAQLLAAVARALQHAHDRRVIHRDVKPANILLEEKSAAAFVADFGLAIREEDYLKQNVIAGSPAYMSPEQARGEGHRLDGRSDVFSLGVIMYELLTGKKPFRGSSVKETMHLITSQEPRPPRELRDTIPAELERVCLKALSKRPSARYATAANLADDLEHWLKPAVAVAEKKSAAQVIPKGLRSFDTHDADFFLDLLPGPRNRDGLPDSIAFWKQRIEQTDVEQTFSVGLIYGPSGCGKSSLVKAGLLPHLSPDVVAVYVEAIADDTETRILRGLRKRLQELVEAADREGEAPVSSNAGTNGSAAASPCRESDRSLLTGSLSRLRRGQGQKVVIIIDQFEQWLHSHGSESDAELVRALRQCDGSHVQTVLMIRDDFAMAAARLMGVLDVPILQGHNFATVDLFDEQHARKVLMKFGQAFGKLPPQPDRMTDSETLFLESVVAGLAQDGKVVSVRLSLFAEMVKGKPWIPETLSAVGGTAGIGVNFLEETFSARTANPKHRLHQTAARAVLSVLLPEVGSDIKGHMRSHADLLAASGYHDRPSDFTDLLRILDGELRLITPTDPEGDSIGDSSCDSSLATRFYQLTHDYLVPSLREWLTRKQKETRQGRAELKLAERSAIWNAKPEKKQLPTVTEWLSIRVLTDSKRWTETQRAMMGKATRVHGGMWGGFLLAVLFVGTGIQQWAAANRWTNLQEQTGTAAEALQNNLGASVPFNLEKLRTLPEQLVVPELQTRFAAATNARHKLSLAFALAGYGKLDAEYLASRIDDIAEADTRNYVTALQANRTNALAALKAEALKCSDKPLWRPKAKLAIAALGLGDTELAQDVCTFEARPDPEQRTLFIDEFPRWDINRKAVHQAVKNSDSAALRSGICLAVGQVAIDDHVDGETDAWESLASQWFVEHSDTSTHSAAGWLLRHWKSPIPEIPERQETTVQRDWFVNSVGSTMLRIRPPVAVFTAIPDPREKFRQRLAELEAIATAELEKHEIRMERAIAYFQTGNTDAALEDLDVLMQDESSKAFSTVLMFRTLTLARMGQAVETRQSLARYLNLKIPASSRAYVEIQVPAWLGDIPESLRQLETATSDAFASRYTPYNIACATALCATATAANDAAQSQRFADQAIELLEAAVSRGYHEKKEAREDPDLAILHGDARFASMFAEKTGKFRGEFWIGDREVTRGQFEAFMNDTNYPATEKPAEKGGIDTDDSPSADHPAQPVSWYDALLYCNWLSQREGLQPCYERTGVKEKGDYAGTDYDAWQLIPRSTGYRLPQEAEWEYACRAGTTTEFCSGDDEGLLVAYCQKFPSKLTAKCGEKLPNAWGLYDMHGNVWEWCEDLYSVDHLERVRRGGSWVDRAAHCRSAYGSPYLPALSAGFDGFRLALSSPSGQSPGVESANSAERSQRAQTRRDGAKRRPELP